MSKKRGRPKCVPEAVDEEELKKVTAFCERYKKLDEEIEDNQFRLARLKDNLKYATSDFERDLYTQDIEYLSHQVEEDTRYKALIKWGLTQLEGRAQSVMEQLYVEGYCWDQIETESGRTLANGSVGNERSKGLKQLTLIITKKKKELEAASAGLINDDSVTP